MLSDEVIQFIESKYSGLGYHLSACVGIYQGCYHFIKRPDMQNDVFMTSMESVCAHLEQLKALSRYYLPYRLPIDLEDDRRIYTLSGEPVGAYLSDDELEVRYVYSVIDGGYGRIYGLSLVGERILSPWRLGFVQPTDKALQTLEEHTALVRRIKQDFTQYDSEIKSAMSSIIPFPSLKKADFENDFPNGTVVVGEKHLLSGGEINLYTITSVKAGKAYDDEGRKHFCDHLFLYDPKLNYVEIGKCIADIEKKRDLLYDEQDSSWSRLDEIRKKFHVNPVGNCSQYSYLSPSKYDGA